MDLRALTTFVQVAESNSFTRAAEKLGYSQPTISVQIKQLEKELGATLFDRIGHTIRLTDKGREVLVQAQRICHLCQEMTQGSELHEDVKGTVRVGMADSLCTALVNRHFARFREDYPNIAIHVQAAGTDALARFLDHNDTDIVVTLDSRIHNTNYITAHEEKIGVHFVMAASHPLSRKRVLTVSDLMEQTFLLTEKGMSYRRLLDEWLARDGREINPILEVGSADLICRLVEEGVGMSFLPDYVTQGALQRGTIVRRDLEDFEPDLWKQLLYHRDKWVSPQMEAVIAHLGNILLEEGEKTQENAF